MIHWRAPSIEVGKPRTNDAAGPDVADAAHADDLEDSSTVRSLQALPAAQVIERLLLPQHRVLRTKLAAISRLTAGAPRAQGSRPHGRLHIGVMIEELATVLLDHMGREERELFPQLAAGDVPQHELGELHYRHGEIDERIARVRELADTCGLERDPQPEGRAVYGLLVELATLFDRHRTCEAALLLAGPR